MSITNNENETIKILRAKRAAYARAYRAKNKEYFREYDKKRRTEDRLKEKRERKKGHELAGKAFVWEILKRASCMVCGFSNPLALEFDHKNPKTKKFPISTMLNAGYQIEDLKAEVDKCRILCANCHAIRTAHQFGNWKLTLMNAGESK